MRNATKDNVNVWQFVFAGGDMDEQTGSRVFRVSHGDLQSANPFNQAFQKRWDNEGNWEVFGHIKALYV